VKRAAGKQVVIKRLDHPDEERRFEKGLFQLVSVRGAEIGRAEYEPGWRWSTHVGPTAGTESCEVEHVGLVVSGRVAVKMDDGAEYVLAPGDVFYVPPGHDSWVVGNERYVSLHLQGAATYAAAPARPRRAVARGKSRPARKRPVRRAR
jgi:quercetin dioxygenase-like cupin family protein